jgi:kumamolisin
MASTPVTLASDALLAPTGDTLLGETPAGKQITVALALPSRDPAGAAAFATAVTTPGNKLYHHYLTAAQYAARFGASSADYTALVAWAKASGLTPGEVFAARTVLPLTGTASSLQAAFGITFHTYRKSSGDTYYAADRAPSLPAELAGKVSGVIGLSSYSHFKPMLRRLAPGPHPNESGTGPGNGFSAADLRSIYNIKPQCCGKTTQQIALFEQGGFAPSDITTYRQEMHIPNVPVTGRSVDGATLGINNPDVELEAVLDVDMVLAANPAAKQIIVYEDTIASFQAALLDSLAAMANDHSAQIISISYGQDEALEGAVPIAAENTVFTQMAAQGQAVFVSAGDSGAYGDEPPALHVSDPASQPLVTAVGGTTLFTGAGESYYSEETWNELGLSLGATGGGISTVWPIPSYQLAKGKSVAKANRGSTTFRNVPDVAVLANPETGVAVYSQLNGGWNVIGGTSVGAPLWAGVYSVANADSDAFGWGDLGFANTALYYFGGRGVTLPDFNDVIDGSNGNVNVYHKAGFNAGPGYDNVTGWGSLNANNLMIDVVLYPAYKGFIPPALPTGFKATSVTSTSITVSWVPAANISDFEVVSGQSTPFAPVLTNTNTAKITGLTPNTYYELYVFPVTKIGINERGSGIYVRTAAK